MEQVAIKAWGNSQGIRIPKSVLDRLKLQVSDVLDIAVENDAIVLRKAFQHRSFEARLAEYNNKISVISDYDWGDPEGREIL